MNQPIFIMVGAPKAGTTSIAKYLKEHPEIYLSKEKEPFYFLPHILKTTSKKDPMYKAIESRAHLNRESYYSLFDEVENEKRVGEATVHYLYHYEEVIPRIKKEVGDVSIIIVLRNPALRAYSNFRYQNSVEPYSFEKALQIEDKRREKGYNSFWFYKDVGNYYKPVKAYLENFDKVHICFFEDLKADPLNFMNNLYSFLEVDTSFRPKIDVVYNPTIVPKNRFLQVGLYFKKKYNIKALLPNPLKLYLNNILYTKDSGKIHEKTLIELKKYYKSDLKNLEKLIKKDLSNWYN